MAEQDFRTTMSEPGRDRVMPQNLDAERAVLAAAILNEDVMQELILEVKDDKVFYRPAHQKVYRAMVELLDKRIPIDQLSLADHLRAKGELDEIGGAPYIVELASNSFALANWRTHLEIVTRCATLRSLIAASTRITALAYDAPDDLNAVVEDAEKEIMAVTGNHVSEGFTDMKQLLPKSMENIEEMADNKSHIIGVPTGFGDLDHLLAGLRGGSLMVLAARPGVGKTAFALSLAMNAAHRGVKVALFSLEMSASEIMPRILAAEAGVELQRIRSGNLQEGDWSQIYNHAEDLYQLDFAIDDTPGLSIQKMRVKARRQMNKVEKDRGLIIVDYLQLMEPANPSRSESRQVAVAEISRGLKMLAKELDMPIIALSQLSRSVEERSDKRPMLSDLRESGAIEQDADIVAFIDRSTSQEEAAQANRPDPGEAKIIVAKNRNGALGVIDMVFIDRTTRFNSKFNRMADGDEYIPAG